MSASQHDVGEELLRAGIGAGVDQVPLRGEKGVSEERSLPGGVGVEILKVRIDDKRPPSRHEMARVLEKRNRCGPTLKLPRRLVSGSGVENFDVSPLKNGIIGTQSPDFTAADGRHPHVTSSMAKGVGVGAEEMVEPFERGVNARTGTLIVQHNAIENLRLVNSLGATVDCLYNRELGQDFDTSGYGANRPAVTRKLNVIEDVLCWELQAHAGETTPTRRGTLLFRRRDGTTVVGYEPEGPTVALDIELNEICGFAVRKALIEDLVVVRNTRCGADWLPNVSTT